MNRQAILEEIERMRPGSVEKYGIGVDEMKEYARMRYGFPAPFDKGLNVKLGSNSRDYDNGQTLVNVIKELEEYFKICAKTHENLLASITTDLDGTPVKLLSHEVYQVHYEAYELHIALSVELEALGSALIPERRTYLALSPYFSGETLLARKARFKPRTISKRQRGLVPYGPLSADPVLAPLLANMGSGDHEKLINALNGPGPRANPEEDRKHVRWSSAELEVAGLPVPAEQIVQISAQDGVFHCTAVLAPGLAWTSSALKHRVTINRPLSQTALAGIIGRPLGDIIEHPMLPKDLIVLDAGSDTKTMLTVAQTYISIERPNHETERAPT